MAPSLKVYVKTRLFIDSDTHACWYLGGESTNVCPCVTKQPKKQLWNTKEDSRLPFIIVYNMFSRLAAQSEHSGYRSLSNSLPHMHFVSSNSEPSEISSSPALKPPWGTLNRFEFSDVSVNINLVFLFFLLSLVLRSLAAYFSGWHSLQFL